MITQTFDLNLIPDSAPVVVHCDQYDRGTGRLVISLYEGSIAYSPSGTAVIQGVKPDGKGFDYNCTLSGNTVTADLTEQMTAVAGQVRTQIVVTESTGRTGTFVFILDVQSSALPADTDMSESDYQLIEQAIEAAQDAVEDSEAWAVGERGGVPVPSGDETYHNNSKYWAEQAAQYAQGGIVFRGSVAFTSIPSTGMSDGDMYNITNDFTTDSRFIEGAGKECAAGTNIVWIEDVEKWDIFAMSKIGSLDDLNDVNISSPTNGQGLLYNSTTQEWENTNIPSGGASALDDLTDVEITTPSSGQVLKYDGSKWVNGAGGSASGDYVGLYGDTLVGSDLNNITSVGNYYNDGTVTVSNYPAFPGVSATSVFRMTVEKESDSSSTVIRQTYMTIVAGVNINIFTRARMSGYWTTWQKVLTNSTAYLDNLVDVALTSPQDNQVLTFDFAAQRWKNKNAQGGGGTASDISYDNTTSGLSATDVQDAIDEVEDRLDAAETAITTNNTAQNNKHKVTSKQVATTGWTSDTSSQSGTTLYKKTITLSHVYVTSPSVDIGAGTGYVLPTSAEQESYNLIQYVTVDDTVPCLYLYASEIPTTAFYIKVTGVE